MMRNGAPEQQSSITSLRPVIVLAGVREGDSAGTSSSLTRATFSRADPGFVTSDLPLMIAGYLLIGWR
jgi:hypothetical protein